MTATNVHRLMHFSAANVAGLLRQAPTASVNAIAAIALCLLQGGQSPGSGT